MRAAPTVAHQRKKYGFAAVATKPATKDVCPARRGSTLLSLRFLSIPKPMYIRMAPPRKPTIFWIRMEPKSSESPKDKRNINGISTAP